MSLEIFPAASSAQNIIVQTTPGAGYSFTWPSGVEWVDVTIQGAGAGGNRPNAGTSKGGGGGPAGELIFRRRYWRNGATSTSYTVGAKGTGATANNTYGTDGGASSFGTLTAAGGDQKSSGGTDQAGFGGGRTATQTNGADASWLEPDMYAGAAGGGGSTSAQGTNGGACGQNLGGTGNATSFAGGGAASFFGPGGNAATSLGGAGSQPAAPSWGAGGGGGGSHATTTGNGADGRDGVIIIEY